MKCSTCGNPIEHGNSIGGVCVPCVFEQSTKRRALDPKDRDRLKREVEAETAGFMPTSVLVDTILLWARTHGIQVTEDQARHLSNEFQRYAGLSVCREVLGVIKAASKGFEEQEEEVRRKIKKLAAL